MLIIIAFVLILSVSVYFFLKRDTFGKNASGERLERIEKSPNYKDGQFQNFSSTPDLSNGYSYWDVTYAYFFGGSKRKRPIQKIPSVKTDLLNLAPEQDILVWFGHSSYYMQIDGMRFLVDPVFSGNASPIPGTNTAFDGTDIYTVDDLPEIDYLFISHDHYDHVDYKTLLPLKTKVKKVICGLGVGAHFEHWGFDSEQILEKDWHEEIEIENGFKVFTTPARHFSGRGLSRNKTLWISYVLQTPSMKIYIGGDSGYDKHYKEIGEKHGPIDIAILDNGQYDLAWQYVHTLPEEVLLATKELNAKRLFPVHSSKFKMANHAWDEPLVKITELNRDFGFPLITPIIGEIVNLDDSLQTFEPWWESIN